MDKKFLTSNRNKSELRESKIVGDFFKEFPDRNVLNFHIFTTNGSAYPAYILRADYKQNILTFPVYSTTTNQVIPSEFYSKFTLALKDIKPIQITTLEEPKMVKYGKVKNYVLSEFMTPLELINRGYSELIINDNKRYNLINFTYNPKNGIYDLVLKSTDNGAIINTNSSNSKIDLFKAGLIHSLGDKKSPNKQQYLLALCNVLSNEYHQDKGFYHGQYSFSKYETYYNKYRDIIYRTKNDSEYNKQLFHKLFEINLD